MNAVPSIHDFSPVTAGQIMETVLLHGDLSALMPDERVGYYNSVCQTIGIDPLMKPFAYIELNKKLTLYALKACTDQLRKKHGVSITIVSREIADDLLTVHVKAKDAQGREDEDLGVVYIPASTKGDARANLILKGITKAKRRVTLSICGLGMLDETEVEDIPAAAKRMPAEHPKNQEVVDQVKPLQDKDKLSQDPPKEANPSTPDSKPQKPGRKPRKADREIDNRYEEEIRRTTHQRQNFERAAEENDRVAWEAERLAEEFLIMEHEIQSCPTLDAFNQWTGANMPRLAQFSDGEQKNGLRMTWANKKASLQPHSLSQKAMDARGPRYARQHPVEDDGLDIPDYLRRPMQAAE